MPLERARYDVHGQTLIVIGLPDRRVRGGAEILWCMQKSFELILFGSNSSAIHRLYERCALQQVQREAPFFSQRHPPSSHEDHVNVPLLDSTSLPPPPLVQAPLQLNKKAVTDGYCTHSELAECIELLTSVSDLDARGRIRNVTILQMAHVEALCLKLGKGPRTTYANPLNRCSLCDLHVRARAAGRFCKRSIKSRGCGKHWKSKNATGPTSRPICCLMKVCCSLHPSCSDHPTRSCFIRAEIEELEEESCHFATELVQYVPLTADASDDEKAKSWTLPSVPAALKAELEAYTLHRTEPLNRCVAFHYLPLHLPSPLPILTALHVASGSATARVWWILL